MEEGVSGTPQLRNGWRPGGCDVGFSRHHPGCLYADGAGNQDCIRVNPDFRRLVLVLLIIGVLTIIAFGMGMPTTPCYILLATLVGPALISMGVDKVLAHLFLFYFGMLSMIAPVAMAAYTAAAISGDSFYRTGFLAWRMALPIFILPYFFVYYPGLALMGSWTRTAVFSALVGLTACSIGLTGYFKGELRYWERAILLLGGLGVIHKSVVTDIIGVIVLALFLVLKMRKPSQGRSGNEKATAT